MPIITRPPRLRAAACLAILAIYSGPAMAEDQPALDHAEFDRVFAISTFEHRVNRNADETPYPDTLDRFPALFAMGGYRMEPPNDENEWYARTSFWHPSTLIMKRGERVLLEFFGINGETHPSEIRGTDITFEVRRGEITQVVFEPEASGIFEYVSTLRLPGMVGQILVLDD